MNRDLFLAIAISLVCGFGGCAGKPPMLQPPLQYAPQGMVAAFTSEDWQAVLNSVVTTGGFVRYDILVKNATINDALMRYVCLIGTVSPDNRPDLFQTKPDQLAYWINSYNAICIYGILLRNQTNPPGLYSTDHFSFGGVPLTLDQVEQLKIKRLADPRVVFAINRGTRSSPPLRKEPYDGLKLNAQLIDQGKIFLDDPRGVIREDEVARVNDLVAVKYAPEFLAAYQQKHGTAGTLLQALQPYAAKHSALSEVTKVVPMEYDGALNRAP
jgi:hypothetical protein